MHVYQECTAGLIDSVMCFEGVYPGRRASGLVQSLSRDQYYQYMHDSWCTQCVLDYNIYVHIRVCVYIYIYTRVSVLIHA